jgi:hypothetical protein
MPPNGAMKIEIRLERSIFLCVPKAGQKLQTASKWPRPLKLTAISLPPGS